MSRPWRIRFGGAKYHVTVRGNNRQCVFHADEDYLRFLDQLSDSLEKDRVILYAYVLMPNHFHLFVETPGGNLSRFMQRLNTAYSMYHRYKRTLPGHCFQGRFGAKLVDGDAYILRLTRYIHLNPVKVAACAELNTESKLARLYAHRWSSLAGYADPALAEPMVDYRWLALTGRQTQRGRHAAYTRYIESFVSKDDTVMVEAIAANRYAIGDGAFVEQVESDLRDVRVAKGVYGDIRWPTGSHVPVEQVAVTVAGAFKLPVAELQGQGYAVRLAKKFALELACRHSGESQRRIGEYFGYRGNGAVGKQRQRLRELLEDNNELEKKLEKTEKALANS
jgi:putative transposase